MDTNVILAALASSRGWSFKLLEMLVHEKIPYLMNVALLQEYRQVIMRPENLLRIPLNVREIESLLAIIVQNSTVQPVYFRWRPNLADEHDNFLVELAVAGQAESIITFNTRDFASAELKFDILIETPKQYLRRKETS